MNQWVPVGGKALLISVTENEYSWLSGKGLFCVSLSDGLNKSTGFYVGQRVFPRVFTHTPKESKLFETVNYSLFIAKALFVIKCLPSEKDIIYSYDL